MKKIVQAFGVLILLLGSQSFFAQKQSDDDTLKFKGDNTTRNFRQKTTVFTGNVSLTSKAISFENAEKVIVDENTHEVKIYKPKNFKIIHVDALAKTGKKTDEDVIVYNTKTNTLSM